MISHMYFSFFIFRHILTVFLFFVCYNHFDWR
nr:MAG TPA: hypothetical protein [Caudoviricetes sp.]DAZ75660.1 MAG TPA: hypothetical protein [Caudoviricetes sp.]